MNTDFTLFYAAIAADDVFHEELVRVYGHNACNERYSMKPYADTELQTARTKWRTAMGAWADEMKRVRELTA